MAKVKKKKLFRDYIEYSPYCSMKTRCYNKNRDDYKYYGAKGVVVCDRWLESFENFLEDMGRRPSMKHSIDRINPFGNYEPGNCRWATVRVQSTNKRIPVTKRCKNCKRKDPQRNYSRGRCSRCDRYLKANGIERPNNPSLLNKMIKDKQVLKTKGMVIGFSIENGHTIMYYNLKQAIDDHGNGVSNVLQGLRNTCKGYFWIRDCF